MNEDEKRELERRNMRHGNEIGLALWVFCGIIFSVFLRWRDGHWPSVYFWVLLLFFAGAIWVLTIHDE